MKKTYRITIITLIIVVLAIALGGTYYFVKENGKKYEIAKIEKYNYFALKQDNLYGVIDRSGNLIIDAKYDEIKIPNPEKDVFICYQGNNIIVQNAKKEEILTDYEKVEPIRLKNIASDLMYEKTILEYSENGKYGLVSIEGKRNTKPIYDQIEGLAYKEGELLVKQEGKYGVINIKGNKLVDINYDQIAVDGYYTSEKGYKYAGYIVANKTEAGYRYGYIDKKGKTVLDTEYNELSRITEIADYENCYIVCAKNGQFGVNKNGEELIKNEYQSINYDAINQLLVLEKSKKYGIANLDGQDIVPTQYDQIDITGIYIYAKNQQGTIVYNSNGTEANIDTNIAILNTTNEKYRIRINNANGTKYGVIGKDGKQIIEEKYNYIEYLYDDYFVVSNENSKLGLIDNKENIKIEIENDLLQKIENTDIVQTLTVGDQVTKLYSKNMKKICEMKNATVELKGDYICVYNDEEIKYFSKEGEELKNTDVYPENLLFAKEENGKWGFVDKAGNVVVDYKYDKVTEFNEYGFASVKREGKWTSIDKQGKELMEPTYEEKGKTPPFFIGKYYQVQFGFGGVYYTNIK